MSEICPTSSITYRGFRLLFQGIVHIFFREVQASGLHHIPTNDPCIFIVGPHANQFVDGIVFYSTNPRQSYALMASVSYNRPIIGHVGKLLSAIPVVRPQDIVNKGTGFVLYDLNDPYKIRGHGTRFLEELHPRDFIIFSRNYKGHVARIIDDTTLEITHVLNIPISDLSDQGHSFKIAPHVDQTPVYNEVYRYLDNHECVTVFPEGGSHDRTEMLPLKAGFAVMALGAMAETPNLNLKIVPVGLNYFHPDQFRSRAVIAYGQPISIDVKDVEAFKQGGQQKREAITRLLDQSDEAFKSVTTTAPDYETLMVIRAARRLYQPTKLCKPAIEQSVKLNRSFGVGWTTLKDDPRLKILTRKVKLYNETLLFFGLRDYQVEKLNVTPIRAAVLLFQRITKLILLAGFGLPALISNLPVIWLTHFISKRKQKEALAGSMVKIAAKDVIATWKIIVAAFAAPMLYAAYTAIYIAYLIKHRPTMSTRSKMIRAAISWIMQPLMHYVLMRLGDSGRDIYKSIKPLFLAIRNPECGKLLQAFRSELSRDITEFVNENASVMLSDVYKESNPESRAQTNIV